MAMKGNSETQGGMPSDSSGIITFTYEQFQQLLASLVMTPAARFDTLAARLTQFAYCEDADATFETWFKRNEAIFSVGAAMLDEPMRVRLLLHKLDTPTYEKYASFILPKHSSEVPFKDTVDTITALSRPQQSLFNARYTCMKVVKNAVEDYVSYAGRVNRECAKFQLGMCTEDQFKCLIFVCGLQSSDDAFIRFKLLDKIEGDPTCTVKSLTEECNRLLNLRYDTKMIEDGSAASPVVHSVKRTSHGRQQSQSPTARPLDSHPPPRTRQSRNQLSAPRTPCWYCGAMHFNRDCTYRQHRCSNCRQIGHKEGFCDVNERRQRRTRTRQSNKDSRQSVRSDAIFSVSRSKRNQYRRFATNVVDDKPASFQVDTASDVTIISETTWRQMDKPALQPTTLVTHSASGNRIEFLGQRKCTYDFKDASAQGTFYVAATQYNLLGAEWIAKLGIYAIMDLLPHGQDDPPTTSGRISTLTNKTIAEDLRRRYPNVFNDGLGRYIHSKATLQLKTNHHDRSNNNSRKLRTTLSLLKPTVQRAPGRDTKMEQQFNKHHGTRNKSFKPGNPVLVRNYQGQRSGWTEGRVIRRIGRVLYKVLLGRGVCTRHANSPCCCGFGGWRM